MSLKECSRSGFILENPPDLAIYQAERVVMPERKCCLLSVKQLQ